MDVNNVAPDGICLAFALAFRHPPWRRQAYFILGRENRFLDMVSAIDMIRSSDAEFFLCFRRL
jgi:hypothetical protein